MFSFKRRCYRCELTTSQSGVECLLLNERNEISNDMGVESRVGQVQEHCRRWWTLLHEVVRGKAAAREVVLG